MSQTLPHALRAIAERQPERPALGWRGSDWTFGDLWQVTEATAQSLAATGLPQGARVALLLRNSPQYVALYYATLLAGYAAVPLNSQERASVLARQIAHCGATLIVGDQEHPEWAPLLAALQGQATRAIPIRLSPGESSIPELLAACGESAPTSPPRTIDENDLATIIYTSGTTGRPKGVMLSHRNLVSNTRSIIDYLELRPTDRGLGVLPFHFSYGNSVLNTHLLAGAYLGIEDNVAFPQATLQRLQDGAFTGFSGVPSTFALLLGRCRLSDFDFSHLRYMTQAGGPMPRALVEQLTAQLPSTRLFLMYGQTEATARLAYLPPDRLYSKPGSVGLPLRGVDIEIRRNGQRAAAHVIGEVYARGPNVMLGYCNDAEATAAVLQDGWLKTGDLGHFDEDGFLYLDGRAVDMIKAGAFRVSPQEIEEIIASLEGVQEVAVTGVADELLGQAIKAVVVPKPGCDLQVLAIKAHCRSHLAAYKVPKHVELATTLPRTASGKVQRFKLAGAETVASATASGV